MDIDYRSLRITLYFEKQIEIRVPFLFTLRSVLGSQLYYLSCVLKQQKCIECPLRLKCAFSVLFENPVNGIDEVKGGIDKGPSPYIIQADYEEGSLLDSVDLKVRFMGQGMEYIPYFLLAVKRAGENGLYKERIKYKVSNIIYNNKEYSLEYNFLDLPYETYSLSKDDRLYNKSYLIEFITPFRYKRDGRYILDINMNDIFLSIKRRLDILAGLYGTGSNVSNIDFSRVYNVEKDLYWYDSSRYSRRQLSSMKIGGIKGSLRISGSFSGTHISLLEAGKLFNIGKNVSFGMGHIKCEEV